jgi:hypothetical protein
LSSSAATLALVSSASFFLATETLSEPATPVILNVPEPFFSIDRRMISCKSAVFST